MSYQKCTGYQNEYAILANGLCVDGVCAVLDLLKWKVLV